MRTLVVSIAVLGVLACGGPRLETRTFQIKYLDPDEAATMIEPYVYLQRPNAPGEVSRTSQTLTVRETGENLDRIAAVLAQFDKPRPGVRLHFQIIGADGAGPAEPRIAEVETELRKLFRFEGYRLLAEAVLSGTARSDVSQQVGGDGGPYILSADVRDVRTVGDTGIATLDVHLQSPFGRAQLNGQVSAREGQTVVLGNADFGAGKPFTVILTVRAELVRQ